MHPARARCIVVARRRRQRLQLRERVDRADGVDEVQEARGAGAEFADERANRIGGAGGAGGVDAVKGEEGLIDAAEAAALACEFQADFLHEPLRLLHPSLCEQRIDVAAELHEEGVGFAVVGLGRKGDANLRVDGGYRLSVCGVSILHRHLVAGPSPDYGWNIGPVQPPFGNRFGVPVYVDASFGEAERIVCQAGTHTDTVSFRYSDFEQLVKPIVADLHRS